MIVKALLRTVVLWLLLVGCGLEPVYIQPSPAVRDDTFIWLDAQAAPPEGYRPVVFAPPDGSGALGVCRSFIVEPERAQGYSIGFMPPDHASCTVAYSGVASQLRPESGLYQQLWANPTADYSWVSTADIPDGPLVAGRLYQNNQVPIEPIRRLPDHAPIGAWLPCAVPYAGRWYVGKVGVNSNVLHDCYIGIDGVERAVRGAPLVLYALADDDPDLLP